MRVQDRPPIETTVQPAPTRRWHRQPVVWLLAFVAAVAAGVVLLLFTLGFFLVAGSSSYGPSVEAGSIETRSQPADPRADHYFGSLELAQGSSINLGVANLTSVDDVVLVGAPTEVDVELYEDANGVRINIAVPTEHPTGTHTLVFDIAGEPEPISWEFRITSR